MENNARTRRSGVYNRGGRLMPLELAVLVTTIDDAGRAKELSRAVLDAKLAACVQVKSILSYYIWEGEFCENNEYLLQMKHRREDYPALAAFVRERHSYKVPQILRVDVDAVDDDYLAWVFESTQRDAKLSI